MNQPTYLHDAIRALVNQTLTPEQATKESLRLESYVRTILAGAADADCLIPLTEIALDLYALKSLFERREA